MRLTLVGMLYGIENVYRYRQKLDYLNHAFYQFCCTEVNCGV